MQISLRLALLCIFVGICATVCFSQVPEDTFSQGATSQDCSDPTMANSASCANPQNQNTDGAQGGQAGSAAPVRTPVLTSPTNSQDQYSPSNPPTNPSEAGAQQTPVRPE